MGIPLFILGIIITLIAMKLHFFRFKDLPRPPVRFKYPIWGFIGYLLIFFIGSPLIIHFIKGELMQDSPIVLTTVLQILALALTVVYLFFFFFIQTRETLKRIWIHPDRSRFKCVLEDFGLGMLTWIIAFPVIVIVSQLVEYLTYLITGLPPVEQIAIRYLKMASESPPLFIVALFIVMIAAPIIEEVVFRGLLFSYLKQKLGFKRALLLSALIFSLFHFYPSQGVSNFPLLSSLFVLSLYLGFLYERQSSLIAPIALHMTFNSISVIRIFLFSS